MSELETLDDLKNFIPNLNVYQVNEHLGGIRLLFKFKNGYGASVVKNQYSYGVELAVIKFNGVEYNIDYDTPITDDVIGNIPTIEELLKLLSLIEKL